jgi:hypothetical protein
MSSEIAYPVFRTTDAAEALAIGRRLMTVGIRPDAKVRLDARLDTVEDVVRVRDVLPGEAWLDSTRDLGVKWEDGKPADPDSLSPYLPLQVDLWGRPVGSVEDAFTAAMGRCLAELEWYGLEWPEIPEEDLYRDLKHAEVSVQFHRRTRDWDQRADDHTVFVHVRATDDREYEAQRVTWVARHIGLGIIGPPDQH